MLVLVVSLERPRPLSSMVRLDVVCDDTSVVQHRLLSGPDSSEDRGAVAGISVPALSLCPIPRGGSYPTPRPGSRCVAHVRRLEIRFDPRALSTRIFPRTPCRLSCGCFAMAGTAPVRPIPPRPAPLTVRSSARRVRTSPTCLPFRSVGACAEGT